MNNDLLSLTKLLRYDILTATTEAGSGHPTSSLSAVELMATVLFDDHFHYDFEHHHYIFNDRLIFSKGHAAPLYFSLFHAAGHLSYEELMTLRKVDSNIEGHPTPRFPFCDVATGSLGQGLSVGLGMALGIKLHLSQNNIAIDSSSTDVQAGGVPTARSSASTDGRIKRGQCLSRIPRVYVLLGDSEVAEGQIWEAMEVASHYKVNNLVGILDVNRLGQRGETMLGWDLSTYQKRAEAFGWNTVIVEQGNVLEDVRAALQKVSTLTETTDKPTMIIAKTQKGAGISSLADKDNWHGKPLPKEILDEAISELGSFDKEMKGMVASPEILDMDVLRPPQIKANLTDVMATREAYGEGLKELSQNRYVVVLDAETSNSTFAEKMKEVAPERFFEMYIAEQNMVYVALGMSKVEFIPYCSTFAAFLTRAFDQIRMGQYSEGNLKLVGSHAGVSIGVDGSSQMALEDIAMMRSILESVILYPSDPVSTVKLAHEMLAHKGISYLRLTREKTPTLYGADESFPIGGSKVLRSSEKDTAVIFSAGITLHEALKAQKTLQEKGVFVAVVDLYSIKPIDSRTIREIAQKTNHVIVVEDHYPDGGIGDAVRKALDGVPTKITHLAVQKIPRSGLPQELLRLEEIDAEAIINAVVG